MGNLKEILKDVIKTAEKSGREIMLHYGKNYTIHYKTKNNPVTKADLLSQEIIIKNLEKYNFAFLSEELKDDKNRLQKKHAWIIDPLDGTKDFIEKTDEFSIMIGLVENKKPILGVVYNPAKNTLYYAAKNIGSYQKIKNKIKKIKVSRKNRMSDISMLTSRYHLSNLEKNLNKTLNFKNSQKCGSAGWKIGLISSGHADVVVNPSDKTWEWDLCAADIIITEAGGKLTDLNGQKIFYNRRNSKNNQGYIASNSLIHNKIIKTINKLTI